MTTQNVYFYIFDGLVDYEAAYALAAINNPQFQRAPGSYKVVTVAETSAAITTVGGLKVLPDTTLADASIDGAAMVILPGGAKWEKGGNMEAVAFAKKLLERGGIVAAICGATLGLAKGGLLDARKHTSNAPEYLAPSKYKGTDKYADTDAVTDNKVITAGAVNPTGFAREIAKALNLYSEEVTNTWYNLIKTGDRKYFFELMKLQG